MAKTIHPAIASFMVACIFTWVAAPSLARHQAGTGQAAGERADGQQASQSPASSADKEQSNADGEQENAQSSGSNENTEQPKPAGDQENTPTPESSESGEHSTPAPEQTEPDSFKQEYTASEARSLSESQALPHYDLAQHYVKEWDFHMAAIELQAAIMYAPWPKIFHRDYCLVAFAEGDFGQSLAEFMMVVGLGDPIPLDQDEQLKLKRKASKMHYRKGIAYGRKRQWRDAIAEFQWALEYTPSNPAVERSLAFSYANQGEFEKAEKHYANSFSEDPGDGYSHADFAYLLADQGEANQAFKQLSEAVRLEPGAAALHVDMAWMAESKGDQAESKGNITEAKAELTTAQNEFRRAIRLSPNHAGLWAHLGRVLEREGKAVEAKEAYSHALALDPGQEDIRQRMTNLQAARNSQAGEDSFQEQEPAGESAQKSQKAPSGKPHQQS